MKKSNIYTKRHQSISVDDWAMLKIENFVCSHLPASPPCSRLPFSPIHTFLAPVSGCLLWILKVVPISCLKWKCWWENEKKQEWNSKKNLRTSNWRILLHNRWAQWGEFHSIADTRRGAEVARKWVKKKEKFILIFCFPTKFTFFLMFGKKSFTVFFLMLWIYKKRGNHSKWKKFLVCNKIYVDRNFHKRLAIFIHLFRDLEPRARKLW